MVLYRGDGAGGTTAADAHCGSCVAELDHCHGTLLEHRGGEYECTEFECRDLDPARHALLLDCAELPGCDCVSPETQQADSARPQDTKPGQLLAS